MFVYLYCPITFRSKHISHNNFLKTGTLKLQLLCGSIPISEHKHYMVYLYCCLYMYLFYLNSLITCTSVIYISTEDCNPSSIQTQENPYPQSLENMSEEKQLLTDTDKIIPMVRMRQ